MVDNPIPAGRRFIGLEIYDDGLEDESRPCSRATADAWVEAQQRATFEPAYPSLYVVAELVPVAEIDRLRAIEAAARRYMEARNNASRENAWSVLHCTLGLCGGKCADCREDGAQ